MTNIQKQQKKLYIIKTQNYEYQFDNVNDFIKKIIVLDKLKIYREVKIINFLNENVLEKSVFSNWIVNGFNIINLLKYNLN